MSHISFRVDALHACSHPDAMEVRYDTTSELKALLPLTDCRKQMTFKTESAGVSSGE